MATDEPSAPASPSDTSSSAQSETQGGKMPGVLDAQPDSATIQAYSIKWVNVLANDTCASITPCPRSSLTSFTAVGPPGWTITPATTSGGIRIAVPSGTTAGTRGVTYSITDANGTDTATIAVKVTLPPTPDHYNTPAGSRFSHAFMRPSFNRIRAHTLRTINSVPRGGQIKILTWSFSSPAYFRALVAAKKRGVSVQIILATRNTRANSDFGRLVKAFGSNRWGKSSTRGSWVFKCQRSCRGTGGTMHAKVFLFSQAYNTKWITMTGSGNLTDFAAKGQWNQQNTVTNDVSVYNSILTVFLQAKRDTPAVPRQLTLTFPNTTYYFTPMASRTAPYDFMYNALRTVNCTDTSTSGGHTRIRIAMYVWRDNRGDWMARQVRRLWNQGCDIRIIYAIMGNRNKQILYNPGGRGRIPMRQTIQVDEEHRPVWYLHQKYVAIGGMVGNDPSTYVAYQGSFNFSDLGMRSDENWQKINGYANYVPYVEDFNQVWKQRETRAPNPNSYVLQLERLGTGRYQFMEPN